MASSTAQPLRNYRGNCHCGAFVYEATIPEIKTVYQCNCSICSRKAYLWVFPGENGHVKFVKGSQDGLTDYTFGKKETHHLFCPHCGTGVMATNPSDSPGQQIALTARAIQGIEVRDLERQQFDGAKTEPAYKIPKYEGPIPNAEVEGGKLYTGGCHCGDVQLALLSQPLDGTVEHRIVDCDCSVCTRNGYIWAYPPKERVVLSGKEGAIGNYYLARKFMAKTFCKRCGVPMSNVSFTLPDAEVEALDEKERAWYDRVQHSHPFNVRVLEDVDIGKLKIQELSGRDIEPTYVNP